MKLTPSYNTVTIESAITKKQFDTAAAFAKSAHKLVDDKGNELFKVGFKSGTGAADQYGITFTGTTADDKMFVSFSDDKMPAAPVDRKAYLQDKYGSVLFNLHAVETQITEALAARADQISAVADSIVIG